MRLYNVPMGSKLKLTLSREGKPLTDEFVTFHHLDGMYAYITDSHGKPLHLAAAMPVRKEDEYYVIDQEAQEATNEHE